MEKSQTFQTINSLDEEKTKLLILLFFFFLTQKLKVKMLEFWFGFEFSHFLEMGKK